MPRVVKGSSAVGLTGMSMLRSAEGNGRQAREPNMASKACLASSAQPAAQNACAANPAAAPPEAAAPSTMVPLWMVCTQMHHCLQALACVP